MGGEDAAGVAEAERPSDEAILEQQNIIRAEEADKIPFVADKVHDSVPAIRKHSMVGRACWSAPELTS